MKQIKLLLVDDHQLIRTALKKFFLDQNGYKVVGEAASGEEAIKLARELVPDVILMDIQMPGIGGLEATRKILHYHPEMKVLVLTAHEKSPYPKWLLEAGATGYLTKNCDFEELLQAIQLVMSGQHYISPIIAHELALRSITGVEKTLIDKLSKREKQIMLMTIEGQRIQDIAKKLCLSHKTISSYRYHLFEKLNVSNDVELVFLAMRLGMISERKEEVE